MHRCSMIYFFCSVHLNIGINGLVYGVAEHVCDILMLDPLVRRGIF